MLPVITVEQVKVGVEYTALSQSCSICRTFGHSTARGSRNPQRQAPKADNNAATVQQKTAHKQKSIKTRPAVLTESQVQEKTNEQLEDLTWLWNRQCKLG